MRRHLHGRGAAGTVHSHRRRGAYAEVVGVAADTKFLSLTEDPQPLVYYSYAQRPWDPIVHVEGRWRPGGRPASDSAGRRSARRRRRLSASRRCARRRVSRLPAPRRRDCCWRLSAASGCCWRSSGLYGVMAYTVASRQGRDRPADGARRLRRPCAVAGGRSCDDAHRHRPGDRRLRVAALDDSAEGHARRRQPGRSARAGY